jgi:hypothetical protein
VPVGSPEALRRFPDLDHPATRNEVTVVGDGGQVYRGDSAWVVCLWALADHRALSHMLSTPSGRRLARAAAMTAARHRERDQAAGRRPPAPGGTRAAAPGRTYGMAPGWTYDPVAGGTQAVTGPAGDACTDGCAAPG